MKEASKLLEKYKRGDCTEEELGLLYSWFHGLHADEPTLLSEDDLLVAKSSFEDKIRHKTVPFITWKKIAVSAAVLLMGVFSYCLFYSFHSEMYTSNETQDSVVLILDDGREINLSATKNGVIEQIAGLVICKTDFGKLQYRFTGAEGQTNTENKYHVLKTPVGETYEIVLEDGSNVTLNARSTLRFPTSFKGQSIRDIELSGEACFEVAKSYLNEAKTIRQPFHVRSKGQVVEVLGTAFNICAYEDEPEVKTTLQHGAVRVYSEHTKEFVVLNKAGEQAITKNNKITKGQIHIESELAWKRRKIMLEDQDIHSIMRVIARWYPIEVVYKDDFTGSLFGGVLSKDKTLEEILNLVQATGEVNFKIEPIKGATKERRVLVMK